MATPLAVFYKTLAGAEMGRFTHNHGIPLSTATTVVNDAIQAVGAYTPWTYAPTVAVLAKHPLAVFESFSIDVVPGPGTFGRAVSLHTGWGHDGETAPTTFAEFSQLEGYRVHTYGGAADPGEADRIFRAPFNEARTDVLKARTFPIGGRIKFYHFFTEANFGTVQVAGDRFILSVKAEFTVYGKN